jgi:hypothetical protein
MNLPNYFFADLPGDAVISRTLLSQACDTLRRNRAQFLAHRTTESLVGMLVSVGAKWMDPDYPLRKYALEQGERAGGFSSRTLARGLDAYFSRFTPEEFEALLEQELGDPRKLDQMWPTSTEKLTRRSSMVRTPGLLFHIAAGNLPAPAFSSMVTGLLLRSAQFIKCATGASFLPRLFAHSIHEQEPKLGACLEVAEWKGGNATLEETMLQEADCITATGSDEAIAAINARIPSGKRFVSYEHKASFGYVSAAALSARSAPKVVSQAATDVVDWNQLGCLSPHVFYVENGGALSPEQFAEALAAELDGMERLYPRGAVPLEVSARIASLRNIYELRARATGETRLWRSKDSTAWTVIYEADARFQFSCLHRFIYVKSVKDLADALHHAQEIREHVSTVGIAAPDDQQVALVTELAHWGASRVCPLGSMQRPPLMWRHDGRPCLADLVSWTDWER